MTALASSARNAYAVLGDYERFVDSIAVKSTQRSQRKLSARRFLQRHGDLGVWMTRSTATRLVDLHRLKAWPRLTWLFVDRRLRADLELLLAKPPGVDVGLWWTPRQRGRRRVSYRGRRDPGVEVRTGPRQVLRHTAPVLCS